LKNWVLQRKVTSRVEDIQPSESFHTKLRVWNAFMGKLRTKQNEYRVKLQKKEQAKKQKEAKKALAAANAAKKAEEKTEEKKDDDKKEEEKKPEPMEEDGKDEEEEEEVTVDFEGIDIFGTEEVMDIGGGMPLFKEFQNEDWTLMALLFEMHLLSHSFIKDAADPDRKGILLEHFPFYYNRYYKKTLNTKAFGVDSMKELCDLAQDAVYVTKDTLVCRLCPRRLNNPQGWLRRQG